MEVAVVIGGGHWIGSTSAFAAVARLNGELRAVRAFGQSNRRAPMATPRMVATEFVRSISAVFHGIATQAGHRRLLAVGAGEALVANRELYRSVLLAIASSSSRPSRVERRSTDEPHGAQVYAAPKQG